jgi:hypothetical protein
MRLSSKRPPEFWTRGRADAVIAYKKPRRMRSVKVKEPAVKAYDYLTGWGRWSTRTANCSDSRR